MAVVAVLTIVGSLTVAIGSASASVWWCNGGWCTSAVAAAPVYSYIDGPYLYTIPQGSVVELNCYYGDAAHGVWYVARRPGFVEGVVSGTKLATGHDPNPNIPPCQ
jgi:hypothetical protein